MGTKPWYLSKGVWAQSIGILVAVYAVFQVNLPQLNLPGTDQGFLAVILGLFSALGLYARVNATTILTK